MKYHATTNIYPSFAKQSSKTQSSKSKRVKTSRRVDRCVNGNRSSPGIPPVPPGEKKGWTKASKDKCLRSWCPRTTHFLNFFRARWCASRPSERDLRALTSTWLRPPPPPYQRTQTVMVPGGPKDSTLPGQAGLPLAAPHTSSPTSSFLWLFSSDFASVTKGVLKQGTLVFLSLSLHFTILSLSLSFSLSLSLSL